MPTSDETLQSRIEKLLRALPSTDRDLPGWYVGGHQAIASTRNPDATAQAAHSFRELLEKLPEALGYGSVPTKTRDRASNELKRALREAHEDPAAYMDGTWLGTETATSARVLQAADEWLTASDNLTGTYIKQRRDAANQLGGYAATKSVGVDEEVIDKWHRLRRYFDAVSHHSRSQAKDFLQRVCELDELLQLLLEPRPFEDMELLDEIIAKGEEHAD